jgi:hypothetical protein
VKAVALGVALSVLSTTSGFCQTSSEQRTESFNLKKVQELDDFPAIVEHDVGDRRIRLMLTGYSAAPDGYEEKTTAFVSSLVRQLGSLGVQTPRLSPARQRIRGASTPSVLLFLKALAPRSCI